MSSAISNGALLDGATVDGLTTHSGFKPSQPLFSVQDCDRLDIATVHSLYREYVNSSRVDLLRTFEFGNEIAQTAEGCWITLRDGRKILDFTGGIGVLNHGHNHPRILKVRKDFQNDKRMEVHRNYFSQYIAALSHNVAALLPGDLKHSFFPNSGSEAVDGAMKTALKYHDLKRRIFLHSDISFHGKLFGSASVTHSPENHYPYPKMVETRQFVFNDLESVRDGVRKNRLPSGECAIAGLMCEPFNVSNMKTSTPEFLKGIRQICDEEDIVLIFDEVYSGWCKAGHLFYFMNVEGLLPDVLCMAKSFGGGKASISGLVTRAKIFQKAFENPTSANLQTTTFYAFAEETVTAIEAVNIIVEDDYVGKSRRIYSRLNAGLHRLMEKHPTAITDVRGAGALNGVFFNAGPSILNSLINLIPGDLYKDPRFMRKLVTSAVVSELYTEHNVLTFISLGLDIHLIVSPPLIASDSEIDRFLEALDKTLDKGLVSLLLKFVKQKFLRGK